jgi:hypothetical protein
MTRLGCTSAFVFVAALVGGGSAGQACAQVDLFGPDTFKAWADVRLVAADGEKSWLDEGFGKLRYGDETKLDLAQTGVQWTPRLTDTLSACIIAQDIPGLEHPAGIEEAYLKWRPLPVVTPAGAYHFTFRAGQMFPPVSMEHDGTGWTPSRTLTPSAINSWVGEEVLVEGVEASVATQAGDQGLGATLGVFSKDDTAGTMLAWRGWALHDISSDNNTLLPLPSGPQGYTAIFGPYQAYYSRPYDEVDHRLGYYVRADWRPPAAVAFNLEFYDNLGDPAALRNGQWGWATRFWNLGTQYRLSDRDVLLSQAMTGSTHTGFTVDTNDLYAIEVKFSSAYLMLSHDLGEMGGGQTGGGPWGKLTGRIDYFDVKDLSLQSVDNNADRGYALTVAWLRPLTAHLDFALEGVQVWSTHPARVTQMIDPRQAQTQLQMAIKLHL